MVAGMDPEIGRYGMGWKRVEWSKMMRSRVNWWLKWCKVGKNDGGELVWGGAKRC